MIGNGEYINLKDKIISEHIMDPTKGIKGDLKLTGSILIDDKTVESYASAIPSNHSINFISISKVDVNIQPIIKSLHNHPTIARVFICISS